MFLESYIMFQIMVVLLFLIAYFTRQEIIWAITAVFAGLLVFTSNSIQSGGVTSSPTYSSVINLIFLGLAIIFLIVDLFDKYGHKIRINNGGKRK